jgi:hypothetical protein
VVVAVLVTIALAECAAAQTVAGTVVSADFDRPVPGANVVLFDTALTALDSTVTDRSGRFRLATPRAGEFVLIVRLEGYLSMSASVRVRDGETTTRRIELPLVSVGAAAVMREAIARESALQLPLDELCEEPLRPWEAGVVVGVTRDRRTLEPVPEVLVTLEPEAALATGPDRSASGDAAATYTRMSTASGAYWFCNVPSGRARLVARAGARGADTSWVTIRAGTVSWSDAILRRP